MDDRTIPEFKSLKELRAFANTRPDKFPKGKHFKHVVLDADDTLWKVRPWGVASICVPEGKTSSDELPVRCTWERDKQRIKYSSAFFRTAARTLPASIVASESLSSLTSSIVMAMSVL